MKNMLLEVPERWRDGLKRYACDHVATGGFLRAVLEDRLMDAVGRMDRDCTIDDLRALLAFIHNDLMPGPCHGSPKAVADWIAQAQACRAGETACFHDRLWYESQPKAAV